MILKKKKIISVTIYKAADWYVDDEKEILKPTKIPLVRLPYKCGVRCEMYKFCQMWSPVYRMKGINKVYKQNCNNYTITEKTRLCNCGDENLKFMYIFTYENLRKRIPTNILKDLGLWQEPKFSKKQIFIDDQNNKKYNFHDNSKFKGNIRRETKNYYRNYNTRRK